MRKKELFNMISVTMFAGILDANIFNQYQLMSSAQTGNLMQLAVGIAHGSSKMIINSGMILLAFISGVFLLQKFKQHEAKLYIVFNILTLISIQASSNDKLIIIMCGVLLGAQLEMYRKVHSTAVNSTIMTGNLRKAIEPFSGQAASDKFDAYLPLISAVSFFVGAIIGSIPVTLFDVRIVSYSIVINVIIQLISIKKAEGKHHV